MVKTFILSTHFRAEEWVSVQREYLDRYADVPHERHFAVDGIDLSLFLDSETTYGYSGDHGDALDLLARSVLEKAEERDWLIFLDSDAFPVIPVSQILSIDSPFISIQRVEHLGLQHPHPSFTAVRAGTYRALNASWKNGGYEWRDESGRLVADVGSGFIPALAKKAVSWQPLRKIAAREFHPIFFALYGTSELGPMVYHHGAGSKRKHTAIERYWESKRPVLALVKAFQYRVNSLVSPRLWGIGITPFSIGLQRPRKVVEKALFRALKTDVQFWRRLYPSRSNAYSWSVRNWARRTRSQLHGTVTFSPADWT